MAKSINELLSESNIIRNAGEGENTAARVAGLFTDIIDYLRDNSGSVEQVQSDWNQSDNTKVDFIRNKPNLATKQDTLVSGVNIKTINNESILGSGNISIGGGGTFTQVQSDWNETDSSKPAYIKNKPTIPIVPTNVSSFTNDAGYLTQHQDISGKVDKSVATVNKSSISNVNTFIVQECTKTSANNNYHHIVKVNLSEQASFFINIYELNSGSDYKEYKICGYITADGTTLGLSETLNAQYYKEYVIRISNSLISMCVPLIYNYSFNSTTSNLNIS